MFTAFNGRFDAEDHEEQFGSSLFEARHPIAALEHNWISAQSNCARDGLHSSASSLFATTLGTFFEQPRSCLAFQVGPRALDRAKGIKSPPLTELIGDQPITYLDFPDGALTVLGDVKVSAIFVLQRLSFPDIPGNVDLVFDLPKIFAVVGPQSTEGTYILTWSLQGSAWELFCSSIEMMGDPTISASAMDELVGPRSAQIKAEVESSLRRVLHLAQRGRPERDWTPIGQISSDEFDEAAMVGRPIFDASLFRVLRVVA
jgi:hypothetical protein